MWRRISIRGWLSIATLALVVLVLVLSRHELARAWHLLGQVNGWILLLLIPVQIISYYAVGAMIFSYLKQKCTINASSWDMAKMALELNFVNHILPSGGVSGASYMTWRLGHYGIGAGRATLAQVVRFAATFGSFLLLLVVAVIAITLDGNINRFTILVSSGLASTIIFSTLVIIYFIKSPSRLRVATRVITRETNRFWRRVLRRQKPLLYEDKVNKFFNELHDDYMELARNPAALKRPFVWGIVFTLADVGMFWITFWALGTPVNPAPLLIAYGFAALAGTFILTPGGVGGFEALMVAFLVTTGINKGAIIAAVLLTRVLLILGTIITGYVFYQRALNRYGRHDTARQ